METILTANMGRVIPKISSSLSSSSSSSLADGDTAMKVEPPLLRRTGNYQPPIWDFQFIQSLHNPYVGDKYMNRFNDLKEEMKNNLMLMVELDVKLELIDNLERLGVSYHFKDEIMQILKSIHDQISSTDNSLYSTALKFRLLRQHGFHILSLSKFLVYTYLKHVDFY
ncbi:hypothetical protein MTR67_006031 [Solanum verrucosum]|uniref:Terpene synthase N-terminal domain-containing protein n=1 Tax=Solanum verrucosum TaxID=315347 RepID=A0AAF0PXC9_SOLVR|nr:hypothetical protein MTR67_006031 [Solanum verrucosum]